MLPCQPTSDALGQRRLGKALHLPVYECRGLLGQHGVEEDYCSPVKQAYKETFLLTFCSVSAAVPSAFASTLVIFNTTLPSQKVFILVFSLLSDGDIWYNSYVKLKGMAGERKLSPS